MALLPSTWLDEWSDADACKHAISLGRGTPSARVLLPHDAAQPAHPYGELTLRNQTDKIVREVAGGWEFELDAHRKLSYTHSQDQGEGFKTSVLMDRAPVDWFLDFDLLLPKGAAPHYQPKPTQEEIDDGVFMPDNVIGSYAIYGDGAAKLGHLYRPFVQDNKGATAWCVLSYENGILTVNLPRAWMESGDREWPILLDPYFGYNAVGGTETDFTADRIYGCGASTPASDGDATKMEIFVRSSTTDGRTMGIYADNASAPAALLRDTAEDTQAGTGWLGVQLDSPLGVTNGTDYWVAVLQGDTIDTYRDTLGSLYYESGLSYTPGALPNPFPVSPNHTTLEYSIRCEYTVAGGLSIPIAMRHYLQIQGAG